MVKILDIQDFEFCSVNKKTKNLITGKNNKFRLLVGNTEEYNNFVKLIQFSVIKPKEIIEKPYKIKIESKSNLDIDNPVKAIFDGLTKSGVIIDDRYIIDCHIIHERSKKETGLKIWLEHKGDS